MLGNVTRIIEKQNESGINYKFGFISDDNGNSYYFDKFCLAYRDRNIDNFFEECTVEFDPVKQTERKYDKAINVRVFEPISDEIETQIDNIENDIRFYRPGIVGHIKDNLSSVYRKSLKSNTGEDAIIDSFSKLFYITKVDSHSTDGYTYYPFCLLGATEILKRYVRGQREFLLIFSHFDMQEWQIKTLKLENEIRKRRTILERNPLPNFYLLVSNAVNFKSEIDSIKGEPRAAIIPFTFSELLECKGDKSKLEEIVLNRFQEYHFENNLLGENKAIEDDNLLFGDRGKIADAIVERCRTKNHSGIFGLRRSGKTSVLNATLRRLEREGIKYVKIESRTELVFSSWRVALYNISKKVKEAIEADQYALGHSRDDYLENAPLCFVNDMKTFNKGDNILIIAIDEIELITYNTASAGEWQMLEAYNGFWSALRDSGCVLLICGVNSSINEKNIITFENKSIDNPMYGRIINCSEAHKTYLPAFTAEQTKYMINTLGGYSGIAFSNVYSNINRAFGGQPYAIRQFCAYVFDNVKSYREHDVDYEVSLPTIENLIIKFNNSYEGHNLCDTILQHIHYYNEEYNILTRFAHSPEKYNNLKTNEVQNIDHLIKYGLIEYDYETGYTIFKINSIKDYICANIQKDVLSMNSEERRRYVQDFVADFEVKLKTHILTYYRAVGMEYRFPTVIRSYFTSNLIQNPPLDKNVASLKDLLDHKKFILHFSTLRNMYEQNWSTLGQIFAANNINPNRFTSYMRDLNAGRTDADHYTPAELKLPDDKWDIDDITMQRFHLAKESLKSVIS